MANNVTIFGLERISSGWFAPETQPDGWFHPDLLDDPVVGGGGLIKVWNGSAWAEKPVKVWTGSAWVAKPLKRWTGSAWV